MGSNSLSTRVMRILMALVMVATLVPIGNAQASGGSNFGSAGSNDPPYATVAAEGGGDVRAQLRPVNPRRAVVQWRPGIPRHQIEAAGKRLGFRVVRVSQPLGWALVEPTERRVTPEALIERLREARLTARAEVERHFQPLATSRPNDPQFGTLWGLDNTGQTGGVPDADIDAPEAWENLGTGSKDVVVAIIDTGVDHAHADLRANRWINQDEIPNNGRDDDRNGYVDDRFGYDFYNKDATPFDPADGDQHGTHVAGTIGAAGNNGVGVAGVNWNVTLMPLKFLGRFGGWDFDGAEAIIYAVDNGADIINASWGGYHSPVLQDAIEYAAQHGVLFVAAAGNDSVNVDMHPDFYFPASSPSTNVVTVAATDHNDELAPWSNFGRNTVEVAAPGVDVNSTLPWDTSALFINSPPYRIAYLAMAVESLEPTAARNDIIARSVTQAGAVSSTPIIVVDDSMPVLTEEVPGGRLQVYLDALSGAGFTNVTTWNTETQGVPSSSALRGRVVLWFTGATAFGWFGKPTLDAAERAAIGHFLDNGGRLVMASGEVSTDMTYFGLDSEWFEKYFKSTSPGYWIWGYGIRGVSGTPYAGIEASLPDEYRTPFEKPWPTGIDTVVPIDPSARPMMQAGGYGELSGTSMAAPHVSGALALLRSEFRDADADELKARIENTADPLPALDGVVSYGGRINIDSASRAYPGRPVVTSPRPSDLLLGGTLGEIEWTPAKGGMPDAVFEVEQGLPVGVGHFDFEAGDLSSFEITGNIQWEITEDPAIVHAGTRSLRTVPIAQDTFAAGSIVTTVSVASDGVLEFWARHDAANFSAAALMINEKFVWTTFEMMPWTKVSVDLHAGYNRLEWFFLNEQLPGAQNMFAIDDIHVYEHQYTPVGTAPAGSRRIDWSVPLVDTDQVRVRVRAVGEGVPSLWAYASGFRITTDDEAPGAPADLTASPGVDGDVELTWRNPADADFASTRVLHRSDAPPEGPNDPAATVVYEGVGESVRHGGMVHDSTHYFAAFARDRDMNWSPGAQAAATVVDTTAPEPPGLLEAELLGGTVVLTWIPPEADKYSGVRVIRRTDAPPSGPNDPAATLVFDGRGSWATDWALTEAPTESKAYYAAWSYDASGNLSTIVFDDVFADTIGPEGVFLLNDGASHTASAVVSADSEVTGATEMRFHPNGVRDEEEPWQPFAHTAWVTLLEVDGPQTVLAEYRDRSGNVIERQADIYVNLIAPPVPTGLSGSPWGSRIELVWDDPRAVDGGAPAEEHFDLAGWNVFIAESEDGPYTQLNEALLSTPRFFARSLVPGTTYWFRVQAVDIARNASLQSVVTSAVAEDSVVPVAGDDRFMTAVRASATTWDRSDTVVLATGNDFADALGASSLAGAYDAPVLLTRANSLPPAVAAELERLGATRIILVGGTGVISRSLETSLSAKFTVERIAGRDRYETSARIAEKVVSKLGDEYSGRIFVASALSHADALSIAPYAFRTQTPILLVDRQPRPVITDAVREIGATSAVVVGGEGVVPESVSGALGVPFIRLWGSDRFETSAAVARHAVGANWGTPALIGIATGATFPDALAGGPALGRSNGLLLLTKPDALPAPISGVLSEWSGENRRIHIFGGPAAVSDAVRGEIRNLVR